MGVTALHEGCVWITIMIHAGCGTSSNSFRWAMDGENQDFADMQSVDRAALR